MSYGTDKEFLEAHITQDPKTGCWLWTGCMYPNGYGDFRRVARGPHHLAHRRAYEVFVGPIPDGMKVCHHCDVRRCINPGHLFLGSQKDNIHDMMRKGRSRMLGSPKGTTSGELNGQAKLTSAQVAQIRADYVRGNGRTLARKFGVSPATISLIVNGKHWGPTGS